MDGLASAVSHPLSIAFATQSVPMTGRTPRERCLGGSESAMIFVAKALAARGHHVDVYARCDQPGEYDGVRWHDVGTLAEHARARDWDAFVSLRFPGLVAQDLRAGVRVLWLQDVVRGAPLAAWASHVDRLVFVSHWHRADTLRPGVDLDRIAAVIENPVDTSWVPAPVPADGAPVLVHLSRPERGLRALIAAWPRIHARHPEAQLKVARYRSFNEPHGSELEAFCLQMDEAVRRLPNAEHVGNLSKPELYALLTSATAMVYPAEFDETSCIAAIEAQACGCPVVATRRGALPETLAPEAAVFVEPGEALPERFADAVSELLDQPERLAALGRAGRARAEQHDVARIAEKWEALFLECMEDRTLASAGAVARTLAEAGDLEAALALGVGVPEAPAGSPGLARWPGVRGGLAAVLAARVQGGASVLFLGDPPTAVRIMEAGGPHSSVSPFPWANEAGGASVEPAEIVVDLGGLLAAPDRAAYVTWLAAHGERVIHVLADAPGSLHDQRVRPDYWAIHGWFGSAADPTLTVEGEVPWGRPARAWVVEYASTAPPPMVEAPARKRWARPRPTIAACLIVRDGEDTLLTTLRSVQPVVDEIHVLDTGSRDGTRDVVESFARRARQRVVLREMEWPHDFAAARNDSMAQAETDWILWIDADERLISGEKLRRYAESDLFDAFAIRQHNHMFDAGVTHVEIPFRMFRQGRGYRFYGAIHEHPERGLNEPITPWTLAEGVEILHSGYLTEPVRRRKLLERNLGLLDRDFDLYPGRLLTIVLYLRDCVNLARFDRQEIGAIRPRQVAALRDGLARFEAHFFAERGRYHDLGRPYYDDGLRLLGEGVEVRLEVGGDQGAKRSGRVRTPQDGLWLMGLALQQQGLGGGSP